MTSLLESKRDNAAEKQGQERHSDRTAKRVLRGPRKVVRLFGERRSNGVSELFVPCTEMSDIKFVTTMSAGIASIGL